MMRISEGFICADCANRDHESCKEKQLKKDYSSCDCLHRVGDKQ